MAFEGVRQRVPLSRRGLAVVLAGAALLAAAIFPRYYPNVRSGPRCSDLAPPLGGNNRSVLAFNSDQRGALDLELSLEKERFSSGEAVRLRLTFINEDQGPIILHLNLDEPILTANETVAGVTFEITRVGGGAPIADQGRTYQPPATFSDPDTLHLLGSRARCSEEYTLSATDLAAIGVTEGEYRIRAHYRNTSPGDPRPIQPIDATATPYPEYATTQGVWVGEARSNEVRFAIGGAFGP